MTFEESSAATGERKGEDRLDAASAFANEQDRGAPSQPHDMAPSGLDSTGGRCYVPEMTRGSTSTLLSNLSPRSSVRQRRVVLVNSTSWTAASRSRTRRPLLLMRESRIRGRGGYSAAQRRHEVNSRDKSILFHLDSGHERVPRHSPFCTVYTMDWHHTLRSS